MPNNMLQPYGFGSSDPFFTLHREMNRLFDDVFRGGTARSGGLQPASTMPSGFFNASMDVCETDKEMCVTLELPGVASEDVDISLHDDMLTIRGEKKFQSERGGGEKKGDKEKKENYHFVERSYGSFQRSLRLPYVANPDEVKASFQDGVLTISIPKGAQQERMRKIPIQGAAGQSAQSKPPRPH